MSSKQFFMDRMENKYRNFTQEEMEEEYGRLVCLRESAKRKGHDDFAEQCQNCIDLLMDVTVQRVSDREIRDSNDKQNHTNFFEWGDA